MSDLCDAGEVDGCAQLLQRLEVAQIKLLTYRVSDKHTRAHYKLTANIVPGPTTINTRAHYIFTRATNTPGLTTNTPGLTTNLLLT